jgi:hypothetical protein
MVCNGPVVFIPLWSCGGPRVEARKEPQPWRCWTSICGIATISREQSLEDAEDFEIESLVDYVEGYRCLPQSGNHPLSVCLWTPEMAVLPVLDSLPKHSARLWDIVLASTPPTLIERLSQFKGDLRSLRRITFTRHCDSTPIFHHAPNLTEITFVNVRLPIQNYLRIPWSQLMRYCETDSSWHPDHDAQERLASYRQLTNLVVLCMDFVDLPRMGEPIILPNLRSASFRRI